MPPKRTPKKSSTKATPRPTPAKRKQPTRESRTRQPQAPKAPHSDLEILAAFESYATSPDQLSDEDEVAAYEEEIGNDDGAGAGALRVPDVRRCLRAIGLPAPPAGFFEEEQMFVSREDFLALAQTLGEGVGSDDDDDGGDGGGEDGEYAADSDEDGNEEQQDRREVDEAFALFLADGGTVGQRNITLADLRRVAKSLKEDVDDKTLMLMIEEANGEVGSQSVARGVGRAQFEEVMRRARVFS